MRPKVIPITVNAISPFTNVPVKDTKFPEMTLHKDMRLFHHVLRPWFFCFAGHTYTQTYLVLAGLLLSPTITNFFMEDFEERTVNRATNKPLFWLSLSPGSMDQRAE
jgi:hypothetical protein